MMLFRNNEKCITKLDVSSCNLCFIALLLWKYGQLNFTVVLVHVFLSRDRTRLSIVQLNN